MTPLYAIGGAISVVALLVWIVVRKSGAAARQKQIADQIQSAVEDGEDAAEIQSRPTPRGRALLDRIRRRSRLPNGENR